MICPVCQAQMNGSAVIGWICPICGHAEAAVGMTASDQMAADSGTPLGVTIDDVNVSIKAYIRQKYWRQFAVLIPLGIAYELALFILLAPIYFGHGHDNDIRPFIFLVFGPAFPLGVWLNRLSRKFEAAFLEQFAASNGFSFDAKGTVDQTYGSIFRIHGSPKVSDVITGSFDGHPLRIFLYDLTVQQGKSSTTYPNTVVEITLPGQVPPMMLDNKRSRINGLNVGDQSGIKNTITLEGDFSQRFTLHAPAGIEVEALQVFAPDVMALVEDETRGEDIEFVADRLYIYVDRYITKRADLEQLFALTRKLSEKVAPIAARLAHDSMIVQPPVNLTEHRLFNIGSKRVRFASIIMMTLIIGVGFIVGFTSKPEASSEQQVSAFNTALDKASGDLASSSDTKNNGAQLVADGGVLVAAAATDGQRATGHYFIANGYFWQQNYTSALVEARLSQSLDPSALTSVELVGELLVNTHQPNEAIAVAKTCVTSTEVGAACYRILGFAEVNLGNRTQAVSDLSRAASLDVAAGRANSDSSSIAAAQNPSINFMYFNP